MSGWASLPYHNILDCSLIISTSKVENCKHNNMYDWPLFLEFALWRTCALIHVHVHCSTPCDTGQLTLSLDYQLVLNYSFVYITLIVFCVVFIHLLNSRMLCYLCACACIHKLAAPYVYRLSVMLSAMLISSPTWSHHWMPDPTVPCHFNGDN